MSSLISDPTKPRSQAVVSKYVCANNVTARQSAVKGTVTLGKGDNTMTLAPDNTGFKLVVSNNALVLEDQGGDPVQMDPKNLEISVTETGTGANFVQSFEPTGSIVLKTLKGNGKITVTEDGDEIAISVEGVVNPDDFLLVANDLNDLEDVSEARTNLFSNTNEVDFETKSADLYPIMINTDGPFPVRTEESWSGILQSEAQNYLPPRLILTAYKNSTQNSSTAVLADWVTEYEDTNYVSFDTTSGIMTFQGEYKVIFHWNFQLSYPAGTNISSSIILREFDGNGDALTNQFAVNQTFVPAGNTQKSNTFSSLIDLSVNEAGPICAFTITGTNIDFQGLSATLKRSQFCVFLVDE